MNLGLFWVDFVFFLIVVFCIRRVFGVELVDVFLMGGSRLRECILEKNGMCFDFCCFGF